MRTALQGFLSSTTRVATVSFASRACSIAPKSVSNAPYTSPAIVKMMGTSARGAEDIAKWKQACQLERTLPENSTLFVCDIQETFRPVMPGFQRMLNSAVFMVKASMELGIPIIVTEQVPFKPTVTEIASLLPATAEAKSDASSASSSSSSTASSNSSSNVVVLKKTKFSMLIPEVRALLFPDAPPSSPSPSLFPVPTTPVKVDRTVYMVGIEGHVCVLQTCLDLLREGVRVILVTDAICSQRDTDLQTALRRMENAGAIVTTAESAVYALMEDSKHPTFKRILPHVKEHAKNLSML